MSILTKGIDVSKYQGNIDWSKVSKSNVDFAIIRLGYRGYGNGSLELDPFFHTNMKGAEEHNVPTGVYFFSQAINASEGEEEAKFVLKHLKGYKPLYPIYFDAEFSGEKNKKGRADNISKEARTAAANAFCRTLEKAGYYAGVYTYTSFALEGNIDYNTLAKGFTMWLADYRSNYNTTLRRDMHQYSSSGSVNGIYGGVDMNTCTIDFPTVIKNNSLNGWKVLTDSADKCETISLEKYEELQSRYNSLISELSNLMSKYVYHQNN